MTDGPGGGADGDRPERRRAPAAVARIADEVRAPVGADRESGYAEPSEGVAGTVRAVLATGAAGCTSRTLRTTR
ncbi:hypothetical protein GCM10027074_15050 [Streptomyces deserti]